jgi:quercetin dioxygenase-like cupin family protein
MKTYIPLVALMIVAGTTQAKAPAKAPDPAPKLASSVFEWDKLTPEPKNNGVRRAVLDGLTSTVDRLHVHITTLGPGERSGEPTRHLQEEVIIVREGTIEANFDGQVRTAGPGSVIFFASTAVTFLRNVGAASATYTVVYYYTPLTPKV